MVCVRKISYREKRKKIERWHTVKAKSVTVSVGYTKRSLQLPDYIIVCWHCLPFIFLAQYDEMNYIYKRQINIIHCFVLIESNHSSNEREKYGN